MDEVGKAQNPDIIYQTNYSNSLQPCQQELLASFWCLL